jgi:hypothetical protein
MTKITTYIDKSLLTQAVKETHAHSQREVLEAGLRILLSDVRRRGFVRNFDKLRLGFTGEELKWSRGPRE